MNPLANGVGCRLDGCITSPGTRHKVQNHACSIIRANYVEATGSISAWLAQERLPLLLCHLHHPYSTRRQKNTSVHMQNYL